MTSPHRAADATLPTIAGDTGLHDGEQITTSTANDATTSSTSADLTANATATAISTTLANGNGGPAIEAAMQSTLTNGEAIAEVPILDMSHIKQEPVVEPSIPHIESENGDTYGLTGTHPLMNMGLGALNMGYEASPFMPLPLGMSMDMSGLPYAGNLESSPAPDSRVTAYAALAFPDGMHYMNTTKLILGRDNDLYKRLLKDEKREEALEMSKDTNGSGPLTPQPKTKASRYTHSVVSQSGGFFRKLGKGSDGQRRKKSRKSRRSDSPDGGISRRNSGTGEFEYKTVPIKPDDEVPAPVTDAHRPDPDFECTLLIHPMLDKGSAAFKKISRKHCGIAYNYQLESFEMHVYGNNGVFVNGQHYSCGSTAPLKGGDVLQIAEIEIQFLLPETSLMDDDYETTENGKQISLAFDENPRDPKLMADSDESDAQSRQGSGDEEDDNVSRLASTKLEDEDDDDSEGQGDEGDGDEEEQQDQDEEEERMVGTNGEASKAQSNGVKVEGASPKPEKRGPGRPPKDGIMSKKKARELQRQQESQVITKEDGSPAEKGKNPVGRPRKHPRPEGEDANKEKRKYTKRKPKDPNAPEGEDDKDKKEKKERRPRSPSPVFNEADLTPEQLAKPQQNYVQLIFDALKARPEGKMSLPQIYRAIARKYPYFVLKCGTVGWQSSVRHNLSQNDAFTKVERDGKGWMWAIVPGADVHKEKKKKPTPPPQMPPHPHYYPLHPGPHPPHMMPHPMGPPPPGYMHGPMPPGARPPYPPGQYPPNGYQMPPQGYPPPLPPPPPIQQSGYSSPYAQKPPPAPAPAPQPSSLGPNGRPPGPPPQAAPGQSQPQQARPPAAPGPPATSGAAPTPAPVASAPPPPPVIDESVGRAVESFRGSLVKSLAGKSDRAELVVKSAIDRVLGISNVTLVPGDPHEEKIMGALRNVLAKMTAHTPSSQFSAQHNSAVASSTSPTTLPQQSNGSTTPKPAPSYPASQPPPTPQAAHGAPAPKPPTPISSISRPSLGPQRPLMGVARPPMTTPSMSRTNSGSPAPKTYSASPAPQATINATEAQSQPNVNVTAMPQAVSADTSAPAAPVAPVAQVESVAPVTQSVEKAVAPALGVSQPTAPVAQAANGVSKTTASGVNDGINDNGKRRLSEEDVCADDTPEVKKQREAIAS